MPVTIRDVADRAGTSVAAVSAVISENRSHNIRIGRKTRERILAAAAELGYKPNPLAKSLVTGKTGVLGLVFPYSRAFTDGNPFSTQIMSGVFEEVVRERYNLMLHTATGDDWNRADENAFVDPRVDGLLLVIPASNSSLVDRCRKTRFPYVALVYASDDPEVFTVNADDFAGGQLATEHLLATGHRRIAHFTGNADVSSSAPRQRGYLAALEAAGIQPDPEWIVRAGFDYRDGYAAVRELLALPAERRPTAVFTANDLCAEGALRALREAGLRVPEDMAVVGFDDTWFTTMIHPAFTLIELLVVIAIIAILAAILFPVFAQAIAGGRLVTVVTVFVQAVFEVGDLLLQELNLRLLGRDVLLQLVKSRPDCLGALLI